MTHENVFPYAMQPDAVDQLVAQIRTRAKACGLSKLQLAVNAKLHANTLRLMGDDSWNPSLTTLRKLAAFLAAECDVPGASERVTHEQSASTQECSST